MKNYVWITESRLKDGTWIANDVFSTREDARRWLNGIDKESRKYHRIVKYVPEVLYLNVEWV